MKRGGAERLCKLLIPHLLMGACLGLLCAVLLLAADLAHVREFFSNQPDPSGAEMGFALGLSLAVGATITGYLFIAMDN